jgi:hypothetical protein
MVMYLKHAGIWEYPGRPTINGKEIMKIKGPGIDK